MTHKESLIAFILALKNQDQQSRKKDIKKWKAEKEKKVGSLKDISRMFRHYKDNFRDKYADFCDDTKDAIENLEKESSYKGRTWYPALWDCFDKHEVIANLEWWASDEKKLTWQANVIALALDHRDWTVQKIADTVGKSRQTLYKDKIIADVLKARNQQKRPDKSHFPHGEKDSETGNLEAW